MTLNFEFSLSSESGMLSLTDVTFLKGRVSVQQAKLSNCTAGIHSRLSVIESLQRHIERLEREADALEGEKEALESDVDYVKISSLIAPIRTIPDEILSSILAKAVPQMLNWDYYFYQPNWIHTSGTEIIQVRGCYLGRLTLLLVCQRWKRVLYATPGAWNKIIIAPWFPVKYATRSLELAKAVPLEFYIFGPCQFTQSLRWKWEFPQKEEYAEMCKRTARVIQPYLSRTVRLALMNDENEDNSDTISLLLEPIKFNDSIKINLPLLQYLFIEDDLLGGMDSNQFDYPSLKQLVLPGLLPIHFRVLSEKKICYLQYLCCAIRQEEDLQFIKHCAPTLLQLSLHIESIPLTATKAAVTLSKLRTLTIKSFSVDKITKLLAQIFVLPNLHTLAMAIVSNYFRGEGLESWSHLRQFHPLNLEVLHLQSFGKSTDVDEFASFATKFQSLRVLDVVNSTLPETFLRSIKSAEEARGSQLRLISLQKSCVDTEDLRCYLQYQLDSHPNKDSQFHISLGSMDLKDLRVGDGSDTATIQAVELDPVSELSGCDSSPEEEVTDPGKRLWNRKRVAKMQGAKASKPTLEILKKRFGSLISNEWMSPISLKEL